jgi:hypothetical protein
VKRVPGVPCRRFEITTKHVRGLIESSLKAIADDERLPHDGPLAILKPLEGSCYIPESLELLKVRSAVRQGIRYDSSGYRYGIAAILVYPSQMCIRILHQELDLIINSVRTSAYNRLPQVFDLGMDHLGIRSDADQHRMITKNAVQVEALLKLAASLLREQGLASETPPAVWLQQIPADPQTFLP